MQNVLLGKLLEECHRKKKNNNCICRQRKIGNCYRCGSAAFPNFRGGIFPEKCVRTNSRILHQTENHAIIALSRTVQNHKRTRKTSARLSAIALRSETSGSKTLAKEGTMF